MKMNKCIYSLKRCAIKVKRSIISSVVMAMPSMAYNEKVFAAKYKTRQKIGFVYRNDIFYFVISRVTKCIS